MKSQKMRRFLPWLLVLVLLISLPLPVRAEEKYMEGKSADVRILLDKAGGATITETWECFFGGDTITRYRRYYKVPDPELMDIEIRQVTMDGAPMKLLDQADESRPEGCAAVVREDNRIGLEMYLSALNETHTFAISYYVTNAVEVFTDVAEFHWNLTTENEAFDIETLTGFIEIPFGTLDKGLYFWGHGPEQNAWFNAIVDEDGFVNQFELYNENIPRDKAVTVRFVMPHELFPDCVRTQERYAMYDILDEEHALCGFPSQTEPTEIITEPTEPAEPEEDTKLTFWDRFWFLAVLWMRPFYSFIKTSAFVLSMGLILVALLFSRKLEKRIRRTVLPRRWGKVRKKPVLAPQYYRSLPDDMKPALVYKLMSTYPGSPEGDEAIRKGNAFSATVLDLVEAGYLKLGRRGLRDVTYQVASEASRAPLTAYERNVIELYRAAGADTAPRTTKDITEYMRREYSWCKKQYASFNELVDQDFQALGLQIRDPGKRWPVWKYLVAIAIWGSVVTLCFGMGTLPYGFFSFSGAPMAFVLGTADGLILGRLYRMFHPEFDYLTQEGENRYAMWKAYGDFLRDFTLFDEREVQDVALWRKYLVYATALGCSEKVMETLRVKLPQVYRNLISDTDNRDNPFPYEDVVTSVASIDQEAGYTIRHSHSSSDSYDSGDTSDWGGFSDSGGSSDSGSDGSDFD